MWNNDREFGRGHGDAQEQKSYPQVGTHVLLGLKQGAKGLEEEIGKLQVPWEAEERHRQKSGLDGQCRDEGDGKMRTTLSIQCALFKRVKKGYDSKRH